MNKTFLLMVLTAIIWQWNHNPVNNLWSVNTRKGYLSVKVENGKKQLVMCSAQTGKPVKTFLSNT